MYSNKDFEKVWFLYQTEGAPKGISINSFCLTNGIPYNEFDKWYRKTHRRVVPVEITDAPEEPCQAEGGGCTSSGTPEKFARGGILVTIRTREGLYIKKGGLDITSLKLLVERLEGIC